MRKLVGASTLTSLALLALAAALLTPSVSAASARPSPVSTTETFAAGEACLFPIQVVTEGNSGFADICPTTLSSSASRPRRVCGSR